MCIRDRTSPTPATLKGAHTEDPLAMYLSDIYTISANLAGIPGLSLPCGYVDGLPVGLQILGKPFKEDEILRIAKLAFDISLNRKKKICSVDKANVLEVSQLWREIVDKKSSDYPDVKVEHMLVDNAAMQLVREPKQFDVIVSSNLFGDILSDISAMLTGSIGMLPSASLNESLKGLYEPVHGSAPDIQGKNIANPIATILSLSMAFRYSLDLDKEAEALEKAVQDVLNDGLRTKDILSEGMKEVSTSEMGDAIISKLQ